MGAVDTNYTFTATDTITSSKMNNIIDQTTITTDAISGTTLEVSSGKLKVRSQGITSNELSSNAVTTDKITDGSITPAKLSAGAPSWSVGTGSSGLEIGDNITIDSISYIDLHSSVGVDYDARILRESGANGNLVISNTGTGSIKFNDITLGSVGGVAPIFGARAWARVTPTIGADVSVGYKNGSYSAAVGSVVTVTIANHKLKVNDKIRLVFTRTSGTGTVPSSSTVFTVVSKIDDNNFTVAFTSAAISSGTVVAWFITIPNSKNISSGSYYDASYSAYVLNFDIPMENEYYSTIAMGANYPAAFSSTIWENTLGTIQLNTRYNSFFISANDDRFFNVVVFS